MPPLLRENSEFRAFWAGQSISLFGDQITLLALPLLAVLLLHAGAQEMGYLTAAGLVPTLLFALHAGAWVDRRGRRRQVMIAADLGRALLLITIPVAYWVGQLTVVYLYAVAFLVGTLSVLFMVSYVRDRPVNSPAVPVTIVKRGGVSDARNPAAGRCDRAGPERRGIWRHDPPGPTDADVFGQ